MTDASLFGLLNIYKPTGWSSRDVVNRVERVVKPAKAGHAGTLDPLAEGVLVIGVGAATRLMIGVQECTKVYQGSFRLGCDSDTNDSTGQVTEIDVAEPPSRDTLETAIRPFVGEIWQTPPQYSAVHVEGQRAYALARKGESVELAPRQVSVRRVEILRFEWPHLDLLIECGSGTYIRSIGRDLGRNLGCGAVMTALTRLQIGPFTLAKAISIQDLTRENVRNLLQPATLAVAHWSQYQCDAREVWEIVHGRMIESRISLAEGTRCAILAPDGSLAALGEVRTLQRLAPTQVFADRNQFALKAE